MISFDKEDTRFSFRIAGVAISNSKALLHRSEQDSFWALPGGRCEFSENSQETLVREIKEEIGVNIKIIKPLYFVENFFNYEGKAYQELSIIYLMEIHPDSRELIKKDEFYGKEYDSIHGKELKIIFKWFNLKELENIKSYPSFLQTTLQNIKPYPEHIIHKDN